MIIEAYPSYLTQENLLKNTIKDFPSPKMENETLTPKMADQTPS